VNTRGGALLGATAAIGALLGGFAVLTSAAPAAACGDATVIHASFDFITNYQTPDPAPTDVIFEATAVGGDGSWTAWVRAHALVDPIEGGFELGCLDAGTMYEFWFDVDGGNGHSYLFHVGTEYPNAFQHETELFPDNPGWFTLDMRSPSALTAVAMPSAPSDVIRVPTSGTSPLVIAPASGLDRPVQLPVTAPGTATLPGRDVVLAANGAQLTFLPGTVVTGPSGWDGQVMLPTAVAPPDPPDGAEAIAAVRVGTASGGLSFSRPVRIVLRGQAGKTAAFAPEGAALTPITAVCATNDAAALDAPGAGDECAIDDGDDLVIWTTHFTTFAAYTLAVSLPATGQSIGWPVVAAAVFAALLGAALLGMSRRRLADPHALRKGINAGGE